MRCRRASRAGVPCAALRLPAWRRLAAAPPSGFSSLCRGPVVRGITGSSG
uniref:Uncharacterized protein n=1 Tax=Fagus sylvatica TaxID=28930 RepID=A0A2N9HM58_FAGSY